MNMLATSKPFAPLGELRDVRLDIDRGHSASAQKRLVPFLHQNRFDPELTARAKCLLSESLELQGRHAESVENLSRYETGANLEKLEFETRVRIRARLALAYNYTGDFPRAIALLTSTLRDLRREPSNAASGTVYLALSRIYRTINEYPIARDHAVRALDHFRNNGDWRGLAESYFAVALVELFEGEYEAALEHLGQVPKLVGENPAAYLLGMTYTNLAAVCGFVRQPREGIAYLEKAISYYETTEHTTNAIAGYNNLGVHLTLLGEWDRAEAAFGKALELAENTDSRSAKLPMVLDSLGELKILRGEPDEARVLLEKAVKIAEEHKNKWYQWQSLRTLAKCFLAERNPDAALKTAREVLQIGRKIGDRQAVREAHLLIAESFLTKNRPDEARKSLMILRDDTLQNQIDLGFLGELQRLQGLSALLENRFESARQFFGKSASIFEMLGDRYRLAIARFWLGTAFAETGHGRATELLDEAIFDFDAIGAKPDYVRALTKRGQIDAAERSVNPDSGVLFHSLVSRLADSAISSELLLNELASVLRYETGARAIAILSGDRESEVTALVRHGITDDELENLIGHCFSDSPSKMEAYFIYRFNVQRNRNITLVVAPDSPALLPGGLTIDPLLKVVENGLEACRAREHSIRTKAKPSVDAKTDAAGLPDFIYSSPAMENLVDEIRKIRSSDVTVLITGESGTGKELVARSVHQLSGRGERAFVPFNCTAVPKELADAYLFGYRKGAFTGAAASSEGVIRAAAGGTLFLDEIGDLPLELQPKLLRFLQEGEIQPLGESKPIKTDVRIVAATNADLEQMVADGLFREDLYYRLNVIRLQVPPLRERRAEIPALIEHYAKVYGERFGRRSVSFAPQTIDLLTVCDWQGNIRQLCNEIQRIVARAEDDMVVAPDDISPELRPMANEANAAPVRGHQEISFSEPLHNAVEDLERRMIAAALRETGRNVSRSATLLGLTRRGLQMKMVRYNLR